MFMKFSVFSIIKALLLLSIFFSVFDFYATSNLNFFFQKKQEYYCNFGNAKMIIKIQNEWAY